MGTAKAKKKYKEKVQSSIWILKSLLGIVISHTTTIEPVLVDEVSADTMNDIRVTKNMIRRIDDRIYSDKIEACNEITKDDYDYFYNRIEAFLDDLMDEPEEVRRNIINLKKQRLLCKTQSI